MHTIYAPTVMGEIIICILQHENKSLPWPDPTQLSGWSVETTVRLATPSLPFSRAKDEANDFFIRLHVYEL